MYRKWMVLTLAFGFLGAGCDQVTAPSTPQGEIRVQVEGDGQTASTSAEQTSFYRAAGAEDGSAQQRVGTSGEIELQSRVFLRSSAGRWIELTDGSAQQTVGLLPGAEARTIATAQLVADHYTRVRVEFERVRASGGALLEVGVGPLQGEVSVGLGTDGVVRVEREVAVQVESGASHELHIDLNAGHWLSRVNASSGLVAAADFESAVTIAIH